MYLPTALYTCSTEHKFYVSLNFIDFRYLLDTDSGRVVSPHEHTAPDSLQTDKNTTTEHQSNLKW